MDDTIVAPCYESTTFLHALCTSMFLQPCIPSGLIPSIIKTIHEV